LATVSTRDRRSAFILNEDESAASGIDPKAEYEFRRIKDGVWIILKKDKPAERLPPAKEKDDAGERITGLLENRPLSERVEGKFEKLLKADELKSLTEMLKTGEVVRYKGQNYRKSVYLLKNESEKRAAAGSGKAGRERFSEEGNDIEKNGFAVFNDEKTAMDFSEAYREDIRERSVIGIKSFDGCFYFVRMGLFKRRSGPLLEYLSKKRGVYLSELGKTLKNRMLAKVMIEFLKEEGLVIEKRKEFYEAV
jgi:hypothetical protein